ncbi:molybdopterin dinucleotide binding domain-containing protein [Desulfosporosinus sp. I2]|uniref:molybdopterin dinucleotide binding domain-containing protein n=1 Tax=Desulfosporosinus sp. I2 TaxID=1617025 RepID=UPI000696A3ED|nr:molybdopterin dinucleotide binding domain-containing protein [Desulfosporosinus sp. I2]
MSNPPVKFLWFTSSNYLARGTDILSMRKQIAEMELTITVDHFLTSTAEVSDIVLPATTCFESPDIVAGYWHNKIGLNQQAIEPVGECRSELEIAQSLSRMLNHLEPGMCSFPEERKPEEWFQSFTPWLKNNVGISNYRELLNGALPLLPPVQEEGEDCHLNTLTGKYKFLTLEALKQGCPEIPILINPLQPPLAYPYRFLVLHRAEHLNTQFSNLDWLQENNLIEVWLNPSVAQRLGIEEGDTVIIYNELGEIQMHSKINQDIPGDILITYSWQDLLKKPVNILTKVQETDLGQKLTGFPGVAYHDTFVNLAPVGRRGLKCTNGGF